jgi:hypothetical protein
MSRDFARKIRVRKKDKAKVGFAQEVENELVDPEALAAHVIRMRAEKIKAYRIGLPRASSLLQSCIRMHVIGARERLHKEEWSTVRGRLLFGYGNAYHYWVQNTPDVFGDDRVGWWKCLACGKVRYFGAAPTKKCRHCGASAHATVYQEHHLLLKGEYPVSGHPDMFLRRPGPFYRVTELKTINKEDFVKLIAPLADHDTQTQTYMWGCAQDKRLPVQIDPEIGYILYICKAHLVKNLPFKMFSIRRNPQTVRRIEEKLATFRAGYQSYPDNVPAPITECEAGEFRNWRAKQCPARVQCIKMAEESDGTDSKGEAED